MKYVYSVELDVTPATAFVPLSDADIVASKAAFERKLAELAEVRGTGITRIVLTEIHPPMPEPLSPIL